MNYRACIVCGDWLRPKDDPAEGTCYACGHFLKRSTPRGWRRGVSRNWEAVEEEARKHPGHALGSTGLRVQQDGTICEDSQANRATDAYHAGASLACASFEERSKREDLSR